MCGPIALALPLDRVSRLRAVGQTLLYNFGRAVTYAALGAAFGLVGRAVDVAGFQKWLSVAAGVFLLAMAFFSTKMESTAVSAPGLGRLFHWVRNRLASLLKSGLATSVFAVGLLNGLVPCGLVYAAVAGALAVGSAAGGGAFMFLFGLGTWPMMLALPLGGRFFRQKLRGRMGWVQPTMFLLAGLLVLFRAFRLDLQDFVGGFPGLPPICH